MTVHYKVYVSPTHIDVVIPDGDLLYANISHSVYGWVEWYKSYTSSRWYSEFSFRCSLNPTVPYIYTFRDRTGTR